MQYMIGSCRLLWKSAKVRSRIRWTDDFSALQDPRLGFRGLIDIDGQLLKTLIQL